MTATNQIIQYNTIRELTLFNGDAEVRMLSQELRELVDAIAANNLHDIIDALNDIRVLATGAVWKLGQEPELSLKQTAKHILSRKGTFNTETGKWEKDRNQDPSTIYEPNYNLSKRSM